MWKRQQAPWLATKVARRWSSSSPKKQAREIDEIRQKRKGERKSEDLKVKATGKAPWPQVEPSML